MSFNSLETTQPVSSNKKTTSQRKRLPKLKRLNNSAAMNELQGGTAVFKPTEPLPNVPGMPSIGPVVTMPIAIYSLFAGGCV